MGEVFEQLQAPRNGGRWKLLRPKSVASKCERWLQARKIMSRIPRKCPLLFFVLSSS